MGEIGAAFLSARNLSLSEAAILAGLPQRPSDYSPHGNWKQARGLAGSDREGGIRRGGNRAFDADPDQHVAVLCGANGTGKSAVFDAITYALYGEPGRTQATDWLHCESIAERSQRHEPSARR